MKLIFIFLCRLLQRCPDLQLSPARLVTAPLRVRWSVANPVRQAIIGQWSWSDSRVPLSARRAMYSVIAAISLRDPKASGS